MSNDFFIFAERVAREEGFAIKKELYHGTYYDGRIRNVILSGTYEGKPAVLKAYDDPRIVCEGVNHEAFIKHNTSSVIRAPQLYTFGEATPHRGWLIMEELSGGSFFRKPIVDKKQFAGLFLEYRMHFPSEPERPLMLVEQLPVSEFHLFRIHRWLELAQKRESEREHNGEDPVIRAEEFIPRFTRACSQISHVFEKRRMVWCHGHFKPHEVYQLPGGEHFVLTDFAHMHMFPEGYEQAFIIWADWMMSVDARMPYSAWKQGIDEWLEVFRPVARELGVFDYDTLMHASLLERALGMLFADVVGRDRPREELEACVGTLYRFIDDIIDHEAV